MSETVQKTVRLLMMIQGHRRVTIRRICVELGLSRSAAYRWLQSIAVVLPIRISGGVVHLETRDRDRQ